MASLPSPSRVDGRRRGSRATAAAAASRPGPPAPQVADGQGQRVRRVRGPRGVGQRAAAGSPSGVTWALPARPLPVTAALTSLGVCSATGRPRRAEHTIATAPAWAVPITVRRLCWLKTRSTATASGR